MRPTRPAEGSVGGHDEVALTTDRLLLRPWSPADHGVGPWAVEEKATGAFVGFTDWA